MKKEAFILGLVFTFLLIPLTSGLSSTLKESYSPRETAIFSLQGQVITPIQNGQLSIRRGTNSVAFEGGVQQIEGIYYLWFSAPGSNGNYTFVISNVQTYVNGFAEVIDFKKDFVVNGNVTDYAVVPGVLVSSNDFTITVKSYSDATPTISVDFPTSHDITLLPGETPLRFSIDDVVGSKHTTIKVGKYGVEAYLKGEDKPIPINTTNSSTPINTTSINVTTNGSSGNLNESSDNSTEQINETQFGGPLLFSFQPRKITSVLLQSNESILFPFAIENVGNETIPLLSLVFNPNVFNVSPQQYSQLGVNQTAHFNLTVLSQSPLGINTFIYATAGESTSGMVIQLNFTRNESNVLIHYESSKNTSSKGETFFCEELNGKACDSTQACSSSEISTINVPKCCLGSCIAEDSGSGWGAYIGYGIAGVIVAVLIFVYLKYKKTGSPVGSPVVDRAMSMSRPPLKKG